MLVLLCLVHCNVYSCKSIPHSRRSEKSKCVWVKKKNKKIWWKFIGWCFYVQRHFFLLLGNSNVCVWVPHRSLVKLKVHYNLIFFSYVAACTSNRLDFDWILLVFLLNMDFFFGRIPCLTEWNSQLFILSSE